MATQAEQEESHAQSRTDLSSPSPESSLSWCLVQLNKSSPRLDALPGDDPRLSREADKRLRAGQWRALVAIRTHHIKGGSSRIGRYQAQGGLPPLLTILHRPESSRKILDLTLSILANCCTEKETRGEVRRLGGVSLIVEVLKRHASVETVENRAARALGNLAMDPEGSAQIHSAGGVPPLLLCLSLSSSPSSPPSPSIISPPPASSSMLERAQSAARALLYLSDTPSNRLSLLSRGALPALGVFLAPEYPLGLRRTCLRALHELTRGCGTECAREVSVSGVLSHLGPLASGDAGGALEELALKTLANLCSQGCLRPLVGSLGVIQKFTEEAKKDPLKSSTLFKALCLCCKEAVNRAKVKESGGLEVLIGFLSGYRNHPFTRLAVLACVDFVYDEAALEHLQDLGLVPLLVARLVDLARGDDSKMDAGLSASSQCSELSSCFDSFDFPPPEGSRKEEVGKEQGSSSFLSLRSWLLSEGFISSEVELMNSPCCSDGDSGSPHLTSSPSSSSSSSPSPADVCPSQQKPVSCPSSRLKPCRLSVSTSPASPCPPPPPSCTSTPQPKPPASPCKVSSPPRKRARTCSLSSSASRLSRVSLDAPKTPTYQHPYHPEPWAPESPILLLLSRFSHAADPSGALITAPVISALLYYLTWHREPSGRCCRMLVRITCNPNCLQPLVRTGAVALIRHRLCLRDRARPGETDRQLDRVKAKISQLGEGLLDNLRVQSETGFGSGVLTHVVLSGSESDKLHCALCLPLIVSNRVLLKKLLLDSGGLLSALEPLVWLGGAEDEDNGADKCSTFLSAWICPSEQVCASRYCTLYASLLIGCLSSLLVGSKVEPDRPGALEDQWQDLGSASCPCSYQTSNHDLNFLLDDGSLLPANRAAVSGELGVAEAESEYFRALLRGRFDEARRSDRDAVRIRDVSRGMLLPVLHYLHGCRMTGDGAGHCLVLSSLVSGGLTGHAEFQKTPLAEVLMGACRFLVPGLQRTSEDLCMSLLSSLASGTDSQRGPSHPSGAQERHRAHVASSADTDREGDAVCAFLPQAYWFSQRYSYSRLGMSCLSILLRPHMPPSVSSDCLLRLVQQADSTESLRQDLLSLAAAALS